MLIRDTVAQTEELTRLVENLMELARGEGYEEPFTDVDVAELTRRMVDIAKRNHPSLTFQLDAMPSRVRGAPARHRKSVGSGKSVPVRDDLGGGRCIKKK